MSQLTRNIAEFTPALPAFPLLLPYKPKHDKRMKTILQNYLRGLSLAISMLSVASVFGQGKASKPVMASSAFYSSGYAPINGLKMYYEIHGQGEPVILLHGAYMSLEGPMRELAQQLARDKQVIALEMQGHGRTGDVNRPITYQGLADDVAGLMKHLHLDSAHVVGYSMGAGVALQLAMRHPQVVRKLVVLSGSYCEEGMQPALRALLPQITPETFEGSPFKEEYERLSPQPENFPVLVEKLKQLDTTPFNWEKEYTQLKHPLLLVFGDSDAVTTAHANEMFTKRSGNVMGDLAAMPNVGLAVLPFTSHLGMLSKLDWIVPITREFFDKR